MRPRHTCALLGTLSLAAACTESLYEKAPYGSTLPESSTTSSARGGSQSNTAGAAQQPQGAHSALGGDASEMGGAQTGGESSGPLPDTTGNLCPTSDSGVTLPHEIAQDLTLESGKSYELSGPTSVLAGATLTIPPCVTIYGAQAEAILAVLPGGKIEAVGTRDQPIVFTSGKPDGERAAGDWGGVMLLGKAHNNQATPNARPTIEGLVNGVEYGSHIDQAVEDDSSGSLVYVRIEFVGRDLGNGNESNGLTLGAVGRGTTVSHVMVANSVDDCFEWFGGTLEADHLVAFNCDDDMFDTDHGYSGRVQFAFGRQGATTEGDSNGFEMDSGPVGWDSLSPKTSASWANVTLCGAEPDLSKSQSEARYGMVLRRATAGSIVNSIVTGFAAGYSVRDGAPVELQHSRSANFELYGAHEAGESWFLSQAGNALGLPPAFGDCWANPPSPYPAERLEGGAVDDFEAPNANYVGAFEDGSDPWLKGAWLNWSER